MANSTAKPAKDITEEELIHAEGQRPSWTVIAKLFGVTATNVRENWRPIPGFPEENSKVREIVEFMKSHQSKRGGIPTTETMEEVREERERKELEKVSRQVDKATLEVADLKKVLYRADKVEKAMTAMEDTLSNTLVRHDGISVEALNKYWKRKFKEKPPRKVIDMVKAISKPVVERIKSDLAAEGVEMKKMLKKRES